MITATDIANKMEKINQLDEKILFVVGGAGSGKSKLLRELELEQQWDYVEAKELLMSQLFEENRDSRAIQAKESLLEAFEAMAKTVVMIDSIEILFAPILNLKPIDLLRELSKEHPIIVGWRGAFDGTKLTLEHNGKSDYFTYAVDNPEHVLSLD